MLMRSRDYNKLRGKTWASSILGSCRTKSNKTRWLEINRPLSALISNRNGLCRQRRCVSTINTWDKWSRTRELHTRLSLMSRMLISHPCKSKSIILRLCLALREDRKLYCQRRMAWWRDSRMALRSREVEFCQEVMSTCNLTTSIITW